MITLTDFKQMASAMTRNVDDTALLRHYQAWIKAAKKQGCSAYTYLREHLPKQEQKKIATVIAPYGPVTLGEIAAAQRWFQSKKLPVYDTIAGLFVDAASAEQLVTFLDNAVAIRPLFEDFCQERLYASTRDKYETFLKEIRGQFIKVAHCPFRTYREYWDNGVDELRSRLERWYILSAAKLPGKNEKDLSLSEAAEMMKVTVLGMYDWLQFHPEYIFWQDDRIYLNLDQMHTLAAAWSNALPVEALLSQVIADVPSMHLRRVRRHIAFAISEQRPAWLLPEKAFPQQTDKLYTDPSRIMEAQRWITGLLNQIPIWSYKTLKDCTKLSLEALRKKIAEGLISAEPYGDGDWLLCADERSRILALSEVFVSVDDVIKPVLAEKNCKFQIEYAANRENLLQFAKDHQWWDTEVYRSNDSPLCGGRLGWLVSVADAEILQEGLKVWLLLYRKSYDEQWETLRSLYTAKYPETIKLLARRYRWLRSVGKPFIDMIILMMKSLTKDISDMHETEKLELFNIIAEEATESAKKEFLDFVKSEKILKGHIELKPTGRMIDNSAYPLESFHLMTKAMLLESEIKARGLVEKAVTDKRYADLWLYTAVHLFLPWRSTDYVWVRPPELPYSPDETLSRIKDGSFSETDAKLVVLRFVTLLGLDIRNPNKTDGARNTQNLFYNFPESEHHVLGLILAIAAAHYYKTPNAFSFINCKLVADRISISSFYGSDYLQACQNRNFSGHRANKAVMQAVEFLGREGKHYHAEYAYMFSSMLRSHSFGYGKMSETTDVYLRDAAFSGITPEFIAFQMFQRGICSFVVDLMMKDCFGEQYSRLPVPIKTEFMKEVGVPLVHLDNTARSIERAMDEAVTVIEDVVSGKAEMADILHAIALGHGRGKDCASICLCKAADQRCRFPARLNCLGCKYEIKSKAVLVRYIMHAEHLKNKICTSPTEQRQREWLLHNTVDPAIQEISNHIQKSADEDERNLYKQIIREVKNNGITGKNSTRQLQLLSGDIQS